MAAWPEETFVVPALAAGEFLEGAAFVSEERLREASRFLLMFQTGQVTLETAARYGRLVADLRRRKRLAGISTADAWIAAWALEHQCPLATGNVRHFERVAGLRVLGF
jgi:predicted nucleic acid-binding protein